MTDDLQVIDELERRLLATYFGSAGRLARRRVLRSWAPAAMSLAALAAVLVVGALTLLPGSVSPSTAQAALGRAANASTTAAAAVLSPGKAWYARTVQTLILPMQIPPRAGQPLPQSSTAPKVEVKIRSVRDVWLTINGSMKERTVVSMSFVDSRGAALYGRPLQHPTTTTVTVPGHGRLASPLFPVVPLLSYRALLALPTQVSQLRRIVSQLTTRVHAAVVRPAAAASSSSSPPNQQNGGGNQSVTEQSTGTVVGSCCGSAPVERQAVEDLNVIAWLLALPIPPDVRAGLYRTAASLAGVRYDGLTRDVLGREGVEVSVGAGSAQMRLIFDPHTGALLASSVGFGSSALQNGFGPLIETLQTAALVSQSHTHMH